MRPSKHIKFPPPLYLNSTGSRILYCHTCGRVNTTRRSHKSADISTPVKFCSDRCRRLKPGPLDRQIEDAFVALLEGRMESYVMKYGAPKGDGLREIELYLGKFLGNRRIVRNNGQPKSIVFCSEVEAMIFWQQSNQPNSHLGETIPVSSDKPNHEEYKNVSEMKITTVCPPFDSRNENDLRVKYGPSPNGTNTTKMIDNEIESACGQQPKQLSMKSVDQDPPIKEGSDSEQIGKNNELDLKQKQGQRRAEEREMVRRAARRGVAFGFQISHTVDLQRETRPIKKKDKNHWKDESDDQERNKIEVQTRPCARLCEAVVVTGKSTTIVEASFAKGDWGVRWRKKD